SAGQFDDVGRAGDVLERGSSVFTLHKARDVLVEHGAPEFRGDHVDELLAAEDAARVRVIEDAFRAGQTEPGAGDAHRQIVAWRRLLNGLFGYSHAQSECVEPTQRLVECRDIAGFRMVREQREYVEAAAEHVLGEALQRLLGTGFDEYARAGLE